ncbi:MAG: N-acetyltransferase [Beijerinckiaceae bacterium]
MTRAGVRAARLTDIEALVAIEQASFSMNQLTRRAIGRAIASKTQDVVVLSIQGDIVGDAIVGFQSGARIARLTSLAVLKSVAGRGLGGRLLAACEARAKARGCIAMRLEARDDNHAAIALYRKAGYREFARIGDDYDDGARRAAF